MSSVANSFLYNDDGALEIEYGGAIATYVGGLPFTVDGKLVCQLNQPVSPGDAYVGGIRVGPLGGVYVVDTNPPVPFAFSNGFSDGFPASEATISLPENTVAPTITGTPSSSNTLTCNPGIWVGANSISFQWLRNNVPMSGQTGSTFLVISPYIGDVIFCAVTGLNAAGAETAVSNSVTIIP